MRSPSTIINFLRHDKLVPAATRCVYAAKTMRSLYTREARANTATPARGISSNRCPDLPLFANREARQETREGFQFTRTCEPRRKARVVTEPANAHALRDTHRETTLECLTIDASA